MGKRKISKRICTLSVCNNLKENSKKTSLLRNEVSTYTRDIRVFCQGPGQSHWVSDTFRCVFVRRREMEGAVGGGDSGQFIREGIFTFKLHMSFFLTVGFCKVFLTRQTRTDSAENGRY